MLRRLAANNAWSNLRLHRVCARLTKEEWEAPRTSFFPSLPATLNHILIVDWYYLDALERGDKGRSVFEPEIPFPNLEELARAQAESDKRLIAWVEKGSLDQEVRLPRRDGIQVERAGDVLMHLFTHQIHHRGQAHAMLSGTHVEPPQLDEFFLRAGLPRRREELTALGLPLE